MRGLFWQNAWFSGILVTMPRKSKTPTDKEKVLQYERLLHAIQLNAEVAMDAARVGQLIQNICRWSYAHRVGNGELSDAEQDAVIRKAFDNLLK